MTQLFLVVLPLLLLVEKVTIGAKDVRPFDPDAKNFSCCSDHTVDLWDPICPTNKQVKCGKGESCRLDVQLRNDPTTRQFSQMFMGNRKGSNTACYPQSHLLLHCERVDDYLFLCYCGRDDNFFAKCNPLGLLNELKFKFCQVPPNPCIGPTDPCCLYNQSATHESTTNSTTTRTTGN